MWCCWGQLYWSGSSPGVETVSTNTLSTTSPTFIPRERGEGLINHWIINELLINLFINYFPWFSIYRRFLSPFKIYKAEGVVNGILTMENYTISKFPNSIFHLKKSNHHYGAVFINKILVNFHNKISQFFISKSAPRIIESWMFVLTSCTVKYPPLAYV